MNRIFGRGGAQLMDDFARVATGAGLVASHSAHLQRTALIRGASIAYAGNRPHTMKPAANGSASASASASGGGDMSDATASPDPAPFTGTPTVGTVTAAASNAPPPPPSQPSPPPPPPPQPTFTLSAAPIDTNKPEFVPREKRVPSTPLERVVGFAGVGARIALGTAGDAIKSWFSFGGSKPAAATVAATNSQTPASADAKSASPSSIDQKIGSSKSTPASASGTAPPTGVIMSEANAERLAAGLCRMRGAALKIGQMLSIQDESMVPPQFQAVLDRVRDQADVMPRRQLEQVLRAELGGSDWISKVKEFDPKPIAAASIGQVHRAVLHDGRTVAMKIQYPGVAESINSDIENLSRLINFSNILPKGMYLDHTMYVHHFVCPPPPSVTPRFSLRSVAVGYMCRAAAKEELTSECDYTQEAAAQKRFASLLSRHPNHPHVSVPAVIDHLSTRRVLTTEMVGGANGGGPAIPIDKCVGLDQETRNRLGHILLRLCLSELFEFRFMQTDPNWSNFLYQPQTGTVHLIDFGASRDYPKWFVDEYLRMIHACAERQRDAVVAGSIRMGFLTGDESPSMTDAHVQAGFIVGEPFGCERAYDFRTANIAGRLSPLASRMLSLRLTPPPKEAYTLHRKLSGAFLTCKKLGAKIACRPDFMHLYQNYRFDTPAPQVSSPHSTTPASSIRRAAHPNSQ